MYTTQLRRSQVALSAAALAMGLALAGCGSTAAPSAQPSSQSATPAPSSATPTPTPTPTADLAAFTFTSQKLSLRYPKAWTVESKVFDQGHKYETATFKDSSGKSLFSVIIDFSSYDVGTPVERTVIDSGAVPGLAGGAWSPPLKYAFFAETPSGGGTSAGAYCTLKLVTEVPPDGPGTLRGLAPMPSPTPGVQGPISTAYGPAWPGPYFISVELGPEVEKCASVDGARQWWASAEGQQVKAAVASLAAG